MAIIGMGIGSAFLVSMVASVPLSNLLGLRGLFGVTIVLALAGMLLVLTAPKNNPVREAVMATDSESTRPIWMLAMSVFLLHAVMTLLFVVLPGLLISRHGIALVEHWKMYVPAMLSSVVVMLPVLRWMGVKKTESAILPWACGIVGLALLSLPHGDSLAWMAGLLASYFLGFNLLEAAMPALVARFTGGGGRGRKMGLYSTFQFLGAFAGGAGGGLLLSAFGAVMTLTLAGVTCIAWGGFALWFTKRLFPTGL